MPINVDFLSLMRCKDKWVLGGMLDAFRIGALCINQIFHVCLCYMRDSEPYGKLKDKMYDIRISSHDNNIKLFISRNRRFLRMQI